MRTTPAISSSNLSQNNRRFIEHSATELTEAVIVCFLGNSELTGDIHLKEKTMSPVVCTKLVKEHVGPAACVKPQRGHRFVEFKAGYENLLKRGIFGIDVAVDEKPLKMGRRTGWHHCFAPTT